jgi:hypothetical protein
MGFKKGLIKLLKISLPSVIIALLLAEVVVRLFLSPCERPSTYFDEEYQIVKYQTTPQEGTYTVGLGASIKGAWSINNQGWNSTVDFKKKTDLHRVAVIGDSYVEGFHVNVEDRFSELLRDEIGDTSDVMELGRAGAPLSQYLHMARYAYAEYHPNTFVINVVANDFDGTLAHLNPASYFLRLNVDGEEVTEARITSYPKDKTNSFWKNSALIRYLYYNAKLGLMGSAHQSKEAAEKAQKEHQKTISENFEKIRTATEYVVTSFQKEFPDTRLIIILDAPRPCIYANPYADCQATNLFEMCADICHQNGVECINMGPVMQKHFEVHGNKFEYEEDLHWNTLGHKLVYQALLDQL